MPTLAESELGQIEPAAEDTRKEEELRKRVEDILRTNPTKTNTSVWRSLYIEEEQKLKESEAKKTEQETKTKIKQQEIEQLKNQITERDASLAQTWYTNRLTLIVSGGIIGYLAYRLTDVLEDSAKLAATAAATALMKA